MILNNEIVEVPTLAYRRTTPLPEGLKRIAAIIKVARGNTGLLHEALVNANGTRDLRGELIQEFVTKCRNTRSVVQANMPWLAAEARSGRSGLSGSSSNAATANRCLNDLQAVEQELDSVLRLYDDLERAGYNTQAQEHFKNEHTIRLLTLNASGMSVLSVDDVPQRDRQSSPTSHMQKVNALFQLSQTGRGNAELLREALTNTQPADLDNELVREFLQSCRNSQTEILRDVQWADMEAARSRRASHSRTSTREEQLLESLLGTDEALTEALKMYDDVRREHTSILQAGRISRSASEQVRADPQTLYTLAREGRGNAQLLHDLIVYAKPGEIDWSLVKEFYHNCQASQKEIAAKIPSLTTENAEELLGEMLGANEELNRAMGLHDDVKAGKAAPVPQKDIASAKSALASGVHEGRSESVATTSTRSVASSSSSGGPHGLVGLPPLHADDRAKFMKLFFANHPKNGVLSGEQVRNLLLKSMLPPETLSKIWDLSDVDHRGVLNVADFTVAMYLVQCCMAGHLPTLPDSLPAELYERSRATALPLLPKQVTGLPPHTSGPAMPVQSGGSSVDLHVPPSTKTHADRILDTLDSQKIGRAQDYVVTSFMLKLGISMEVLNQIWALVDIGKKGYLTRDEFARGMTLVDLVKAGKELPASPTLSSPMQQVLKSNPTADTLVPSPAISVAHAENRLIDLEGPVEGPSNPPRSTTPQSPHSIPTSPLAINTLHALPPRSENSVPATPFRTSPPSPSAAGHFARPGPSQQQQHPKTTSQPCDIDPAAQARFDVLFDALDSTRKGYIEGDIAVPFFSKSKLPDRDMAAIWDLADRNHDGRLTRDEFSVVMHLILERLRGKEVPDTLPHSLAPPTLRPVPERPPSAVPPTEQPPVVTQSTGTSLSGPPPFSEEPPRLETPPPPYEAIAGA